MEGSHGQEEASATRAAAGLPAASQGAQRQRVALLAWDADPVEAAAGALPAPPLAPSLLRVHSGLKFPALLGLDGGKCRESGVSAPRTLGERRRQRAVDGIFFSSSLLSLQVLEGP